MADLDRRFVYLLLELAMDSFEPEPDSASDGLNHQVPSVRIPSSDRKLIAPRACISINLRSHQNLGVIGHQSVAKSINRKIEIARAHLFPCSMARKIQHPST